MPDSERLLELFELNFTDGFVTARHTATHGDLAKRYPWHLLRPEDVPPALLDRARHALTVQALSEYGSSVSMAQMVESIARARMPVDLLTLAAGFVAEELVHAECFARLAMQLGGATPIPFPSEQLALALPSTLTVRQRANELVVRLCCVGEAFSGPMLKAGAEISTNPLIRAILDRLVRDEALHGRFGWLYLDWVQDQLDDKERTRLGAAAKDALAQIMKLWPRATLEKRAPFGLESLGWLPPHAYRERALETVESAVRQPLKRYGILLE